MCIRDSYTSDDADIMLNSQARKADQRFNLFGELLPNRADPVSYTHLRAHETVLDLVCRLLLEKKKVKTKTSISHITTLHNKTST